MLNNLFANLPPSPLPEEVIETLVSTKSVRIERIVSEGHCSLPDFWYDQPEHEWVTLLKGSATIRFKDHLLSLIPGDWTLIPAHTLHRVEATSTTEQTVWLAIFYGGE